MKASLLRLFILWLSIYVLVLAGLTVLRAIAADLPLAVSTLILTLILVPTISFLIVPMAGALTARLLGKGPASH